ncbi:MAG: hypothetical protein HYS80_00800 [Candidatus Aenigmarchaeota archaeon]|nr:hypothetical protein [Candidatus Aenigmarchaeota archaeon]
MEITEFLIFLFSTASIQPTFTPYKMVIKNRFWWTYAFSAHAVTMSALAILFSFWYGSPVLKIITGTLMLISGYGGWIISTAYAIENKKLFKFLGKYNIIYALIHHFFMAIVGVWFLFTIAPTFKEMMYGIVILIGYVFFMSNKLNVPWILYRPSKIPLKTRKLLIKVLLILFSVLLPVLSFIAES